MAKKKETWPKEVTEIKPVTEYTTSDGEKFLSRKDAVNHENEIGEDDRREAIRLNICKVLGIPTEFEDEYDERGSLVADADELQDDAVSTAMEGGKTWVLSDVSGMEDLIDTVEDILMAVDGKLIEILSLSKDLIKR